jgi:hypothetical protein
MHRASRRRRGDVHSRREHRDAARARTASASRCEKRSSGAP